MSVTLLKHFYHDIRGFTSFQRFYTDMVRLAPSDRPTQFIELGTCFGKSAAYLGVEILNSGKPIKLHTWDSWFGCPKSRYHIYEDGQEMRDIAEKNLESLASVVEVKTGDAIEAAKNYEDESCFFVFVDDDHTYDHVLQELYAWWPKVEVNGVLAGHDWGRSQVSGAVKKFAGTMNIEKAPVNCWKIVKCG